MLTAKLTCRRKRAGTARSAADILVLLQRLIKPGRAWQLPHEERSSFSANALSPMCVVLHSMDAACCWIACYCHTICCMQFGGVLAAVPCSVVCAQGGV